MRVAAVDIGTNTVRLLVANAMARDGRVSLDDVDRREVITRLGEGLDVSGRLGEEPMRRALDGLAQYASVIDLSDVVAAGGVATAATRSAANGEEFVRRVAKTLGFAPRVIDGVEEARLTFSGATAAYNGDETYCVIDVGGGSTEFVVGRRTPDYAVSVDIGSVRLTERIGAQQLGNVDEIRTYVDGLFAMVEPPGDPAVVLGSGGTFVTLAALALDAHTDEVSANDPPTISFAEIEAVVDRLAPMTVDEISGLSAVVPARAGVLLAGVICAERAAARVSAESVRISVCDILDGVAMEVVTGTWPTS